MDSKIILAGGLVLLGGYWIYKKGRETEENTQQANQATVDLSDYSTNAALRIKQALDWEKMGNMVWKGYIGGITTSGSDTKKRANLFNACLTVTNWAQTQQKFSALCGNECTLMDALQQTTDNDTYNQALELIKKQKVVTVKPCRAMLQHSLVKNNQPVDDPQAQEFSTDTVIGAYISNYNGNTSFLNGFASDNYWVSEFQDLVKIAGYTSADNVKIVTP